MEPGLEVFGEEDEFWDLRLEEVKKLKLLKCDDLSRGRSSGGGGEEECGVEEREGRVGVGVGETGRAAHGEEAGGRAVLCD